MIAEGDAEFGRQLDAMLAALARAYAAQHEAVDNSTSNAGRIQSTQTAGVLAQVYRVISR